MSGPAVEHPNIPLTVPFITNNANEVQTDSFKTELVKLGNIHSVQYIVSIGHHFRARQTDTDSIRRLGHQPIDYRMNRGCLMQQLCKVKIIYILVDRILHKFDIDIKVVDVGWDVSHIQILFQY